MKKRSISLHLRNTDVLSISAQTGAWIGKQTIYMISLLHNHCIKNSMIDENTRLIYCRSCVIIFLYYHMMYFIVDIGSDPYLGVLYMALLEVPITTAAWWVVNNFRRRPVYIFSYLLSIFSGIALLFPGEGNSHSDILLNLHSLSRGISTPRWTHANCLQVFFIRQLEESS